MPLGVLFVIFPTPSSDSRGWKGSCLFGTQLGFQTQKVTEFISWPLLLLLRETQASLIATPVLLGFLPTLRGPQVRRYTAQHIPTPLTKEKKIQRFKCQNNELEHVTLTFWRTAFSLCLQQFRCLPREVRVCFPKPIRYQV